MSAVGDVSAVYAGIQHEDLTLPAYGGSLFDPDRFPFLEGRGSREGAKARREEELGDLAAEIAGLSRAEFLTALNAFGITPFQYGSADDLVEEVSGG